MLIFLSLVLGRVPKFVGINSKDQVKRFSLLKGTPIEPRISDSDIGLSNPLDDVPAMGRC